MKKGDLVLIPFPFTDLTGTKTRPALVLVIDTYDITVAFITSKIIRQEAADVELKPTTGNGLKVESFIKLNKLATLDKKLIFGKLGQLSVQELSEVDKKLMTVFSIRIES